MSFCNNENTVHTGIDDASLHFGHFWLWMQQPRMMAHHSFSGCARLPHTVAVVNQREGLCLNAYIFLNGTKSAVYKGSTWQHYTSSPHEYTSKRAQLVYLSGCRQRTHVCRGDGVCTGASSTFQPLVKKASSAVFPLPSHPLFLSLILDVNSEPVVEEKTANTSVHLVTFNQVSDCRVLHCFNGPWQ